jgi:heme/copper-type cytochrome/quinol oxidase subunit 2
MIEVTLIAILSIIVVIVALCLFVLAVFADYKNEEHPIMIGSLTIILMITVFALALVLMANKF